MAWMRISPDTPPCAFERPIDHNEGQIRDLGVGDFAEQHDHYLYGGPKR